MEGTREVSTHLFNETKRCCLFANSCVTFETLLVAQELYKTLAFMEPKD